MNLGQVLQSVESWRKLSAFAIKPSLAYKILKYGKLVSEEAGLVIEQRKVLVCELSPTEEMTQDNPILQEFSLQYQEILSTESSLDKLDVSFAEVLSQVEKKGAVLSVTDLALLEPFFLCDEVTTLAEQADSFRNEDGTPKMVLDSE